MEPHIFLIASAQIAVAIAGFAGVVAAFCGAYDVTAAAYLAWLIIRNRIGPPLT